LLGFFKSSRFLCHPVYLPVAKSLPARDKIEKKRERFILVLFNIARNGDLSLRVTEGKTHNDVA